MSQFSETLTRLMRQKHLKSVKLCEILSIRKSRFSKIKNGGILPTDFSLVEQLAKAMHLNPQEEKELYLSYQMSKFGHTYEQIEASMKRLYEVECPQYYHSALSALHSGNSTTVRIRKQRYTLLYLAISCYILSKGGSHANKPF